MAFKECYLVPKVLYETMSKGNSSKNSKSSFFSHKGSFSTPADVKTKYFDYNEKFPSQSSPNPKSFRYSLENEILGNIHSIGKKKLAKNIVDFIISKTGGTIEWNNDFKLEVDGVTLFDLDIRDVLSFIVGAQEDYHGKAIPIIKKLQELNAPSYFFMFYKGPINVMEIYDQKYDDRYQYVKVEPKYVRDISVGQSSDSDGSSDGSEHEISIKPRHKTEPRLRTDSDESEGELSLTPGAKAKQRQRVKQDFDESDDEFSLTPGAKAKPRRRHHSTESTHHMSLRKKTIEQLKKWEGLP